MPAFATEYKTNPEGSQINKTEIITGINFITCSCIGSIFGGCGLSFWVRYIIPAITTGKTKNGSGAERSLNQNIKGSCLNSTVSLKAKNKAINTGN